MTISQRCQCLWITVRQVGRCLLLVSATIAAGLIAPLGRAGGQSDQAAQPQLVASILAGQDTRAIAAAALGRAGAAPVRERHFAVDGALNSFAQALEAARVADSDAAVDQAVRRLRAAALLVDAQFDEMEARLADLKLSGPKQRLGEARSRWRAEVSVPLAAIATDKARQRTDLARWVDALPTQSAPAAVFGVAQPAVHRPRLLPPPLPSGDIAPSYAQAMPAPVYAEDIADAPDAPLTPAVRAKAAELGHDYVAIFDFVWRQVATEWRAGTAQSVDQTLLRGRGNDVEQAALLVALLRASAAPARFVTGVVEVPVAALGARIGVPSDQVGRALAAAGIANEPVIAAEGVTGFRISHVWVSARLPYGNYRGTSADDSQLLWLPLMPGFEPTEYASGTSVLALLDDDVGAWIEAYLGQRPIDLPWPSVRVRWEAALAALRPPSALPSLASRQSVEAAPLGVLPASPAFPVVSVQNESARLLDEQRQRIRVRVLAGRVSGQSALLDAQIPLDEIAGSPLTLSYLPATVEDAQLALRRGGLGGFPAYLVRVRPTLSRWSEPLAAGDGVAAIGDAQRLEVTLLAPAGELVLSQSLVAGGIASIALDPAGDPSAIAQPETSAEQGLEAVSQVLGRFASEYLRAWAALDQEIASALALRSVRPLPVVAVMLPQYRPRGALDLVESLQFEGVALDAAAHPIEPISERGVEADEADGMRLMALGGSALEHVQFESHWGVMSTSAEQLLQVAAEQGVEVLSLAPGSPLPELPGLPSAARESIGAWLAHGNRVDLTSAPVTVGAWEGAGWRVESPDDGSTGYYLSGGYAGGVTAIAPREWYFQDLAELLADPYAPAANEDPLASTLIQLDAEAQFQVVEAGAQAPRPLRALVTDDTGRPVKGARVRFLVQTPGATIRAGSTIASDLIVQSDQRGVAEVELQVPQSGAGLDSAFIHREGMAFPERVYTSAIEVSVDTRRGILTPGEAYRAYMRAGPAARITLQPADSAVAIAGAGWVRFDGHAFDAYDNEVANHTFQLSVSDRYLGPACTGNFASLAPSALFGVGECQGVIDPSGTSCVHDRLDVTSRFDGATFYLAPTQAYMSEARVVARSEIGEASHVLPVAGADISVENGQCKVDDRIVLQQRFGSDAREAAPLGERLPEPRRVSSAISSGGLGIAGTHWQSLSPTSVTLEVSGGRASPVRYGSPGEFDFDLYAGDQPARIEGVLRASFPAAADGHVPAITAALIPGWSLDLLSPEVLPERPTVDGYRRSEQDMQLRATPQPAGYRSEGLILRVMDNDDTQVFACFHDIGSDQSQCSVPRGTEFPAFKRYRAEYVLNPGSAASMRSAPSEIPLDGRILTGYGLVPPDASAAERDASLAREADKALRLLHEVDFANSYICDISDRLVVRLATRARVRIRILERDEEGAAGDEMRVLAEDDWLDAGEHEWSLSPYQLPFGNYLYEISASDGSGDPADVVVGTLDNEARQRSALPLAHSFVKGVDLFDGHAVLNREDIALPGRGPGLGFSRTYNSHSGGDSVAGVMGPGWSTGLDAGVTIDRCGTLSVTGAAGQATRFVFDREEAGTSYYRALHGYHGSLIQRDGLFSFIARDGTRFHFDDLRRIESIEDPHGNRVRYDYETGATAGAPIRVADSAGRTLQLRYARVAGQSRLVEVRGPEDLRFVYDYDEHGWLVRARQMAGPDSDTVVRDEVYRYRDFGMQLVVDQAAPGNPRWQYLGPRIEQIVDGIDGSQIGYEYQLHYMADVQPAGWLFLPELRVSRFVERDGGEVEFAYQGLRGAAPLTVGVSDARQFNTRYSLNLFGGVERVVDPLGQLTVTEWNGEARQPAQIVDGLGTVTRYTYDDAGNRTSERIQHAAQTIERRWSYVVETAFRSADGEPLPIRNRVAVETDARGHETRFSYDPQGNLLGRTRGDVSEIYAYDARGDRIRSENGAGEWTTHGFDAFGLEITRSDALSSPAARWSGRYDARGRLLEEADGLGQLTTYDYDAIGRRTAVHHPDGTNESTRYDDAARTQWVTDPRGTESEQRFDALGRLLSETQARGTADARTRDYRYDLNGNLLQESDWRGNATTYDYDAGNRRVAAHAPLGVETSYTLDALGHVLVERVEEAGGAVREVRSDYADPGYRRTQQTVASGNAARVTRWEYDGNGNAVAEVDAGGARTEHAYDERDRRIVTRFADGGVLERRYDDADRLRFETLFSQRPGDDFSTQVREWRFDARGRTVAEIDGSGRMTRYGFDAADNPVSRTDPAGAVWTQAFDARHRLIEARSPEPGQVTRYKLDGNGNRTAIATADGRVLMQTFDALNRRVRAEDALGLVQAQTFDADDHPLSERDGLDRQTQHEWDALGRETQRTLPATQAGARMLAWTYDGFGSVLTETDAGGHTTVHEYDGFGDRVRTTGPGVPAQPAGYTTAFTYDALGRVLTVTDPRGTVSTNTYDARGRRVGETVERDGERYTHAWVFDVAGDTVSAIDRAGEETRYSYDGARRLLTTRRLSAADASERLEVEVETLSYDEAGRVARRIDGVGEATDWTYDRAGRRTQEVRALGYRRQWTYTAFDRVESESDGDGIVTRYEYDVRQRRVAQVDALDQRTVFDFDAADRQVLEQRPGAGAWRYEYDAGDQLIAVVSPQGHRSEYGYDRDGLRTRIDDGNRHATTVEYDAAHRRVQTRFADGTTQAETWDGHGNRVALQSANRRIDYEYDALNRETARRYTPDASDAADAAQPTGLETDYDGNGRVVGQRQSSGEGEAVLIRRWDALGRLVEETDLDGLASTWRYDAVGNRRQRSDALGETGYQPDRLHRVAQIAAPGAAAISLSYSPAGRLQAIDHGGGTRSEYGYDAAGRLATLRHVQTGTEVARWAYAYDARGNRTQETEHTVDGERITTWRYDEDERLLGMTTPESDTAYVLDAVGNRIEEVVTDQASGQVTHRIQASFNERDQLIERSDAIGGERTGYTYDVHGNLATETTSGQTTEYRHNVEDRLATLSLQGAPPEQATHYAYGPDGLRIGKRDGSSATRYHYDQGQLRLESNVLGNPQVGYEYAAGHVLAQKTEATQRWLHYLHDAQRSPVRWIDESGTTDGTARYDAWGVKQAGAGNANSIGYTGYYSDAESNQYYAQQRYYRAGVGRFLSVDPWSGDTLNPVTLNKYLYANGNPLIYRDPDGRVGVLTDARNWFDETDERLRNLAVKYNYPIVAEHLGKTAGLLDLMSMPVRALNLQSDLVAQALPRSVSTELVDQGSAELGARVDALAPSVKAYASNPVATNLAFQYRMMQGGVQTAGAALAGDGGAQFDAWKFGTTTVVPFAGPELLLANSARAGASTGMTVLRSESNALRVADTSVAARSATVGEAANGGVVANSAEVINPLRAGQLHEAEQLAQLGVDKNTLVFRPTAEQVDTATFRAIVGDPKYTRGGQLKGTIFDGADSSGYLEIKGGASELNSTYQLRLQTYKSVIDGQPFTIQTTRPVNPVFQEWLDFWGVKTVAPGH